MSDVKIVKSPNFERNLDSSQMGRQIERNTWKSEELLKQASNAIAPVDKGLLRQNVGTKKTRSSKGYTAETTWHQPYAGVRYTKNKKNPQTRYWIKKGYDRVQSKLQTIMNEGVIK